MPLEKENFLRESQALAYPSVPKNNAECSCTPDEEGVSRRIREQASSLHKMESEMAELLKRTWELSFENDELVNDMHCELTENEDLRAELGASRRRAQELENRCDGLERDCVQLRKKLGHAPSMDEIDQVVRKARQDAEHKIDEAGKERKALEEQRKDLAMQIDELNRAIETTGMEKRHTEKKNLALADMVRDLQDLVGTLCIEKAELERKVEERHQCCKSYVGEDVNDSNRYNARNRTSSC